MPAASTDHSASQHVFLNAGLPPSDLIFIYQHKHRSTRICAHTHPHTCMRASKLWMSKPWMWISKGTGRTPARMLPSNAAPSASFKDHSCTRTRTHTSTHVEHARQLMHKQAGTPARPRLRKWSPCPHTPRPAMHLAYPVPSACPPGVKLKVACCEVPSQSPTSFASAMECARPTTRMAASVCTSAGKWTHRFASACPRR